MTRTLLISAALLTFACGHNAQSNDTTNAAAASRPSGGGTGAATGGPAGTTASNASSQAVTLVGCLQGPAEIGTTGTAGSAAGDRARARATGSGAADEQTHGAAANARYSLANVTVESGGVGANGAGASGGPLLSPGSSIDLDGVPADAQNSVNKQVRVTGRIDARPERVGAAGAGNATVGGSSTGAATSGTTGSGAGTSAANGGASGSGVGAPSGMGARSGGAASSSAGGTSTRDDVRANSTTAASGDANGAAARRVTVETVQVVAQSCGR